MAFQTVASAIQFGSTNSLSCSAPSGIVSGETLLAFLGDRTGSNTTSSPPDGSWTQVGSKYNLGTSCGQDIWKKTATGSEPGSYTFTWSANGDGLGGGSIVIVRDNSTSHIISAGPGTGAGVSSTWSAGTQTASGTPDTGTYYVYFATEGSMAQASLINSATGGWTSDVVISNRGNPADTIGHTCVLYHKAYTGNAASGQMDLGTDLGVHYTGRIVAIQTGTPSEIPVLLLGGL